MKFLNLSLIAYGPFTKILLQLPEDKSFHLIYGPNEAGKSSALRALTSALFGIKSSTNDAFLHPKKELRIGAQIMSSDNKVLDFIRRSGRTKCLLDPISDNFLPSNVLEDFLSVADEENFKEIFAIDHLELRRGGDAILKGKGAADQALFTAGTGGINLNAILAFLEDDAKALFSPRAKKTSIQIALTKHKDARRTQKDSTLKASAYKEKKQALATADDRLVAIGKEKNETGTVQSKLTRYKFLIPKVNQKKVLTAQVEPLMEVPDLPNSFATDRQSYFIKLDTAKKSQENAIAASKELQKKIDAIHIDPHLNESTLVIRSLGQRIAQYKSACDDLPKRETEKVDIEREINNHLKELPMAATIETIEDFRLQVDVKAALTELANKHPELTNNLKDRKKELQKIQTETGVSEAQLEQCEFIPEFTSLIRACAEARNEGNIETQLGDLAKKLAGLEDKSKRDLGKLSLWSGSIAELESAVVPNLETMDVFADKLDSAELKIGSKNEQYEAAIIDVRNDEQNIETMEMSTKTATEEELIKARKYRDKGWGIIKKAWLEGKSDEEAIAEFCADKELHEGYEDSVSKTDKIADVLRESSDRTVKYATLLVSLKKNQENRDQYKNDLSKLRKIKGEIQKEWVERWVEAGISPLNPKEMRGWHRQYSELISHAEMIHTLKGKISSITDLINLHRDKICTCLKDLNIEDVNPEATLLELLERGDEVKEILEEQSRTRSELEKSIEQGKKQLPALKKDVDFAEKELKQWKSDWSEILIRMKLPPSTKPLQALAVERVLADIMVKKEALIKLNSRISNISETIQKFEDETKELISILAPDLNDLPADAAIDSLQSKLEQAQKDFELLAQLKEQLDDQQGLLEKAEGEISKFDYKLSELCKIAGVDDPKNLESVEEQAGNKKELTGKLDQIKLDIADQSSGFSEDEIGDLANVDIDSINTELLATDERLTDLEDEKDQIFGERINISNEILKMEQSGEMLADNQAASEQIISAIKEDSERYIRLRLTSRILQREMEQYREANEHPILKSAGNFFKKMTHESFDLIRTEYKGDQNPVLVGIRPNGEQVNVEGMSEGTRDQLYLALKLALMMHQVENVEPMPLILDDLLVNFDDERAKATFELLDEISEHTQILFFTHHKHLAKIANDTVRKERINEITLPCLS